MRITWPKLWVVEIRACKPGAGILDRDIAFVRLPQIEPAVIAEHMSDPRVAQHMPLLTPGWDEERAARFIDRKEAYWAQDGLGHWAFLCDGRYVGWGGFQKEGREWDFGLVLHPDRFGLGRRIWKKSIAFARADKRIGYVTFLLPPTRRKLGALARIGAKHLGAVEHDGTTFLKFCLDTR
jgi:hypothetical protein